MPGVHPLKACGYPRPFSNLSNLCDPLSFSHLGLSLCSPGIADDEIPSLEAGNVLVLITLVEAYFGRQAIPTTCPPLPLLLSVCRSRRCCRAEECILGLGKGPSGSSSPRGWPRVQPRAHIGLMAGIAGNRVLPSKIMPLPH